MAKAGQGYNLLDPVPLHHHTATVEAIPLLKQDPAVPLLGRPKHDQSQPVNGFGECD